MCDYREELLQRFQSDLNAAGLDPEDIKQISMLLTIRLEDYEMAERCTELAVLDTTNEQLIKMYLGSLLTEGKSKRTAKEYGRLLRKFSEDAGKKLTEVTTFECRIWLAKQQQRGVSMSTIATNRSYLAAFFQWMEREEIIEKDPTKKIAPVKFNRGIKTAFSDIEIDAMRSACKKPRERAELELLLASGVREEELCNLDRSDIDFHDLSVKVRAGKGNKPRTTYINQLAAVHLKKYLAGRTDQDPALFMSNYKQRISKSSVFGDVKKIAAAASVENAHPHRFRRTFATTMYRRGMDIRTIQILMGHADINTTMRYIECVTERVQNEYKRYS